MVLGVNINFYFWVQKVTKNLLFAKDDIIALNTAKANRILQGIPENPFEEFEAKLLRQKKPTAAATSPSVSDADRQVNSVPARWPLEILSAKATVPGLLRLGMAVLRGGAITVSAVHVVLGLLPAAATVSGRPGASESVCAAEDAVSVPQDAETLATSPKEKEDGEEADIPLAASASSSPTSLPASGGASLDVGLMALLQQLLLPLADTLLSTRLTSATEVTIETFTAVLCPPTPATPLPAGEAITELRLRGHHLRVTMQSRDADALPLGGTLSVEEVHLEWYHTSPEGGPDTDMPASASSGAGAASSQTLLRCLGSVNAAEASASTVPAVTLAFSYDGSRARLARPQLDLSVRALPVEVVLAASDVVACQRLLAHLAAFTASAPAPVAPPCPARTAPTAPAAAPITPVDSKASTGPVTAVATSSSPSVLPAPSATKVDVFGVADGVYVSLLLTPLATASATALRRRFWGPGRDADTRHCLSQASARTAVADLGARVGALCQRDFGHTPHLTLAAERFVAVLPSPLGGHDVDGLLRARGEARVRERWEPVVASLGAPAMTTALAKTATGAGAASSSSSSSSSTTAATAGARLTLCYLGALHVSHTLHSTPGGSDAGGVLPGLSTLLHAQREPCALLVVHRTAAIELGDGQLVAASETLLAMTAKTALHVDMALLEVLGPYAHSLRTATPSACVSASVPAARASPTAPPTRARMVCLVHGLDVTVTVTADGAPRNRPPPASLRLELTNVQLTRDALALTAVPNSKHDVVTTSPLRIEWHDVRVLFQPDGVSLTGAPAITSPSSSALLLQCQGRPEAFITVGQVAQPHTHANFTSTPVGALAVCVQLGELRTGPLTMAVVHRLLPWLQRVGARLDHFYSHLTMRTDHAPSNSAPAAAGTSSSRGTHHARRPSSGAATSRLPSARSLWQALVSATGTVWNDVRVHVARVHVVLLAPRLAWDGSAFGAPLVYQVMSPAEGDTATDSRAPDDLATLFHRYQCTLEDVDLHHLASTSTGDGPLHGRTAEMRLRVASVALDEMIPPAPGGDQGALVGRVCLVESVSSSAVLDVHVQRTSAHLTGHRASMPSLAYERAKARLTHLCVHHLPAHAGDAWPAVLAHFFSPPPSHEATAPSGSGKSRTKKVTEAVPSRVHRQVQLDVQNMLFASVTAAPRHSAAMAPTALLTTPWLRLVATVDGAETTRVRATLSLRQPVAVYVSAQAMQRSDVRQVCASPAALQRAGFQRVVELFGAAGSSALSSSSSTAHLEVCVDTPAAPHAATAPVCRLRVAHAHLAVSITPSVLAPLAGVVARFGDGGDVGRVQSPAALVVAGGPRFAWVTRQARRLAAPMIATVNPALLDMTRPDGALTETAESVDGAAAPAAALNDRPLSSTTRSAASLRRQMRASTISHVRPDVPEGVAPTHSSPDSESVRTFQAYEAHVLPLLTGRRWREQLTLCPTRRSAPSWDHAPPSPSLVFASLPTTPREQPAAPTHAAPTSGAPPRTRPLMCSSLSLSRVPLDTLGSAGTHWTWPSTVLEPLDTAQTRCPHFLSLLSQRPRTQTAGGGPAPRPAHTRTAESLDAADGGAVVTVSVLVEHCPVHVVIRCGDDVLTGQTAPRGASSSSSPSKMSAPDAPNISTMLAQLRNRCTRRKAAPPDAATAPLSCLVLEVAGLRAALQLYEDGSSVRGVQRRVTLTLPHVRLHDFSTPSDPSDGGTLLSRTPAHPADWLRTAPFLTVHWLTSASPHHSLARAQPAAAWRCSEETVSVQLRPVTLRLTDSSMRFYHAFSLAMDRADAAPESTASGPAVSAAPPPSALFFRTFRLAPTVLTVASTESSDRLLMRWLLRAAWRRAASVATLPLGLLLRLDGVELRVPPLDLHQADAPLLVQKISDALVLAVAAQIGSLTEQLVRPVRSASEIGAAAVNLVTSLWQPRASMPARVYNTTRAGAALWHAGRSQLSAGVSFASGTAAEWTHTVAAYLLTPAHTAPLPSAPSWSWASHVSSPTARSDTVVTVEHSAIGVRLAQARSVLADTEHSPMVRVPAAVLLAWVGCFEGLAASLDSSASSVEAAQQVDPDE